MLKISLLGHPRVEFEGETLEFKRRKAIALLAYLAVNDRTYSRDTLTALLFSDLDEKQARSGLRLLLTDINKTPVAQWLEADRATVTLRHDDDMAVDVRQFLRALDNENAVQEMAQAVALYEDHFMKGFSVTGASEFDDWQLTQVQRFQKKMIGALENLVRHQVRQRELDDAAQTLERWLALDPYYEVAQRQLMRVYAHSEKRSVALRQYEFFVELLRNDLDDDPQPQTTALYEAIKANESVELTEYALPVLGNLPPLPDLVIGREDTLEALRGRLIAPGASSMCVVQGWPGIGKTTLSALIAHDPQIHNTFTDGVLWMSLGETPNLFSELTVWANALSLDLSGVATIDQLSARIAAEISTKRMLLIVDDVWDMAHFAPLRVGGNNCRTLVTSRLNAVAQSLAMRPADVYKIPILSDEKSLELMRTLAPQSVDQHPDEMVELVRDLEGLPLALQVAGRLLRAEMSMGWGVTDLLRELRDDARLLAAQAPADRAEGADEVPPTIEALLRKSTNLLDETHQERFALLGVFAPKPAYFDLDAVTAVWAVDDPRPTVRSLVERGLLEPAGDGRFQIHALLVMHAKSMFGAA